MECLLLSRNMIVVVKVIPITDDVITRVAALAATDCIIGLKFADRNRISYKPDALE
jgi:hypothetical protein